MTKFMASRFHVGGAASVSYDEHYGDIFGERLRPGDCQVCKGKGLTGKGLKDGQECSHCAGTGRASWSKP